MDDDATAQQRRRLAQLAQSLGIKEPIEESRMTIGEAGRQIRELEGRKRGTTMTASREEYNKCMKPYITGSKPAEDRKRDFCIGAKICSGKAADEKEAEAICSLPKEPKEPKTKRTARGKDCSENEIDAIASCMKPLLDKSGEVTTAELEKVIRECVCKTEKTSREKFIKKCFKENSSTGALDVDIKEAAKLRTLCIAKYKEQN